jgi:hypothetical protein
MESVVLNRQELCRRWKISLRTLDRLREDGKLSWINIGAGRTKRGIVRFRLRDIIEFEQQQRHDAAEQVGHDGRVGDEN